MTLFLSYWFDFLVYCLGLEFPLASPIGQIYGQKILHLSDEQAGYGEKNIPSIWAWYWLNLDWLFGILEGMISQRPAPGDRNFPPIRPDICPFLRERYCYPLGLLVETQMMRANTKACDLPYGKSLGESSIDNRWLSSLPVCTSQEHP